MPSGQLNVQPFVEHVEDLEGRGGGSGVRTFHGFLQGCELIRNLNRIVQRVFAAGGFRLDDFFFDGVHFLEEGVRRIEHGLCAGVGGEALLQCLKLSAHAAKLVHCFIAGAYAFTDPLRELFLLVEVGLRRRDARILGDFHFGGFGLSTNG